MAPPPRGIKARNPAPNVLADRRIGRHTPPPKIALTRRTSPIYVRRAEEAEGLESGRRAFTLALIPEPDCLGRVASAAGSSPLEVNFLSLYFSST